MKFQVAGLVLVSTTLVNSEQDWCKTFNLSQADCDALFGGGGTVTIVDQDGTTTTVNGGGSGDTTNDNSPTPVPVSTDPISVPPGLAANREIASPEEWIYSHNLLRCMHGAAPLTWDESLANSSKAWNRELDRMNSCSDISHSNGNDYGENLSYMWASPSIGDGALRGEANSMNIDYSVTAASYGWWGELHDYNFNTPGPGQSHTGAVGHFTAMVWKNTERVGCAMCRKNQDVVYTCQYQPTGNINVWREDGCAAGAGCRKVGSYQDAYKRMVPCIKRTMSECKCAMDRGEFPAPLPITAEMGTCLTEREAMTGVSVKLFGGRTQENVGTVVLNTPVNTIAAITCDATPGDDSTPSPVTPRPEPVSACDSNRFVQMTKKVRKKDKDFKKAKKLYVKVGKARVGLDACDSSLAKKLFNKCKRKATTKFNKFEGKYKKLGEIATDYEKYLECTS